MSDLLPELQPLPGYCRRCGCWVLYARPHWRAQGKGDGVVLEPYAVRGGRGWYMLEDGRYAPNRPASATRWVSPTHRCRPSDVAATLARELERELRELERTGRQWPRRLQVIAA